MRKVLVCFTLAMAAACGGSPIHVDPGATRPVRFSLNNATQQTICFLYISPVADTTWGPDQLGRERTLGPGETAAYNMPAGNWDLKAEDCSHNQLFVMRNQTIAADSTLILHQ